MNFEEVRSLVDELHRENRITDTEYNTLKDCIDEAENKLYTLLSLVRYHIDELLLSLVRYHIDELEDVAKNARRALMGMF